MIVKASTNPMVSKYMAVERGPVVKHPGFGNTRMEAITNCLRNRAKFDPSFKLQRRVPVQSA